MRYHNLHLYVIKKVWDEMHLFLQNKIEKQKRHSNQQRMNLQKVMGDLRGPFSKYHLFLHKHWTQKIFGMAAMPFPCNGILLFQGNLPRVTQVVFQMYRNFMLVFLSPISIFNLCLWGMVKVSVLNKFGMYYFLCHN